MWSKVLATLFLFSTFTTVFSQDPGTFVCGVEFDFAAVDCKFSKQFFTHDTEVVSSLILLCLSLVLMDEAVSRLQALNQFPEEVTCTIRALDGQITVDNQFISDYAGLKRWCVIQAIRLLSALT